MRPVGVFSWWKSTERHNKRHTSLLVTTRHFRLCPDFNQVQSEVCAASLLALLQQRGGCVEEQLSRFLRFAVVFDAFGYKSSNGRASFHLARVTSNTEAVGKSDDAAALDKKQARLTGLHSQ